MLAILSFSFLFLNNGFFTVIRDRNLITRLDRGSCFLHSQQHTPLIHNHDNKAVDDTVRIVIVLFYPPILYISQFQFNFVSARPDHPCENRSDQPCDFSCNPTQ